MINLGVNIDHIATLRQARGTDYPDPADAVAICLDAGAGSITAHLREDRRHIQDRDIERLAVIPGLHLNMEMGANEEIVAICKRLKPAACCLVPEKREELTTEGGLNVVAHQSHLTDVVARLTEAGVRVSMFIDPVPDQIRASKAIGAPVIELHTGHYADYQGEARARELSALSDSARLASDIGLIVHAGHGLTIANTPSICAIAEIEELNIGHAIIADAVFKGLHQAVADFKAVMVR
ncbi:MAG: pyridoxine 5'-phosphate synthase [Mariprofundus sp.]|nr:pyridoxine 5'-phosphate synthase [Mariprofundus sp.]